MKTFIYNSFLYATERNEYLSLTRGTEIVIAIMVVTLLTENLGQLNNYYKAYGAVDNSNTSKSLSTEAASPAAAKCRFGNSLQIRLDALRYSISA